MKKTAIVFKPEWHLTKLSCKYISGKINPYRLYMHLWYTDKGNKWPTEHKKQIASYADLTSVMYHVYKLVQNDEYGIGGNDR